MIGEYTHTHHVRIVGVILARQKISIAIAIGQLDRGLYKHLVRIVCNTCETENIHSNCYRRA